MLLVSDEELGSEKLVLQGWARPERSVKRIEQMGKAYEALKLKYAKLAQRIEMGASAHFESSGEEDEEEKKEGKNSGGSDDQEDMGDA